LGKGKPLLTVENDPKMVHKIGPKNALEIALKSCKKV
jgi:hypothetical protein